MGLTRCYKTIVFYIYLLNKPEYISREQCILYLNTYYWVPDASDAVFRRTFMLRSNTAISALQRHMVKTEFDLGLGIYWPALIGVVTC